MQSKAISVYSSLRFLEYKSHTLRYWRGAQLYQWPQPTCVSRPWLKETAVGVPGLSKHSTYFTCKQPQQLYSACGVSLAWVKYGEVHNSSKALLHHRPQLSEETPVNNPHNRLNYESVRSCDKPWQSEPWIHHTSTILDSGTTAAPGAKAGNWGRQNLDIEFSCP